MLRSWTDADTFPFEPVVIVGHALFLGVFIALGVMTRMRDVIARRGAAGR